MAHYFVVCVMYYVLPFVAANVKANDMEVEIKEDKTLTKFGDLSKGEVFVYDGVPYLKIEDEVRNRGWVAHKIYETLGRGFDEVMEARRLGETVGRDFAWSTEVRKAKKVTIEL